MIEHDDALTPILRFDAPYLFLSNFWPVTISLSDTEQEITRRTHYMRPYRSVEHAYQAAKTTDPTLRQAIADCKTPGQAKRLGGRVPLRPGWQYIRIPLMHDLLAQKFGPQNPELRRLLIDTSPAELVEGNTWGDTFWGRCNGYGHNHLGKLLMQLREVAELDPIP